MEVFNPPFHTSPIVLSVFSPKIPIRTSHHRFRKPFSKFRKILSFPCRFALPSAGFHISAHFGRPSGRRNSLRKKLLDDQKVRQNLIYLDPGSDSGDPLRSFDYKWNYQENQNHVNVKDNYFSYGVVDTDNFVEYSDKELKLKSLGESPLLTEFEDWLNRYKKDTEYWGIGSGPIFTVFKDLNGNVERAEVNEDEILRRSRIGKGKFEDLTEVHSKILYAKSLAKEMETGKSEIPENSYVVKFVLLNGESGLANRIHSVILRPDFLPKFSWAGRVVLCGFIVFLVVKKLFTFGNKEVHYTELEKEMMRRKIKFRREKELLEKDSVEVVREASELPVMSIRIPKLDKQKLLTNILNATASKDKLALFDSSSSLTVNSIDIDDKIKEIREMAKQAREIEGSVQRLEVKDEKEKQPGNEEQYNEMEVVEEQENDVRFMNSIPNRSNSGTDMSVECVNINFSESVVSVENGAVQVSRSSKIEVSENQQKTLQDLKVHENMPHLMIAKEVIPSSDTSGSESYMKMDGPVGTKPRVIRSVKEAREFLSRKCDSKELNLEPLVMASEKRASFLNLQGDREFYANKSQESDDNNEVLEPLIHHGRSESGFAPDACEKITEPLFAKKLDSKDANGHEVGDSEEVLSLNCERTGTNEVNKSPEESENWLEKNFHEVEPIVKKMAIGFRDNYMVAREKGAQELSIDTLISQLGSNEDENELDWMEDDKLREIVFQVRENELAGRDPFYLMDTKDKLAFFQGLETKVDNENQKLSHLHEWLHSNIENLDYGADGISMYDPPEKIVPRWKGPPLEKNPQFLNNYQVQRKALFSEEATASFPVKKDEQALFQKSAESQADQDIASYSLVDDVKKNIHNKNMKKVKTVIEGSDGSIRSGKKSGKEYWQHTKKWSRGFLESYNAETDPEVKFIMKDIGKDLDRWITEEEIQEAADLMTKLPERNKKFMEKKLNKLNREMELFGPQAVVSKYREYVEEKEEDYLWWLDLPHVLCIEIYKIQNKEERIGFYALEMAADLELEPKPNHVIAFQDAADCKNLCHIIQAHLNILGNGNAFVVPRPPKDAFREAKANGFGVTVISKGELQLNVDQTLEEVEEQLCEIGSKMYHDKIMQERSVDMSSLMKGIFGTNSKVSSR